MKKNFIATTIASPCYSADDDGNALLDNCKTVLNMGGRTHTVKGKDAHKMGYCRGLLRGLILSMQYYKASSRKDALYCTPDDITSEQAVRVVVKYLEGHPEELHETDAILATKAFMQAFPCK
jgi:hypothetical protein